TPRIQAPAVPMAEAERQQAQRREALEALPTWSLAGRVAISTAQKGGSGRLEWSQQDGAYRVSLSAPVTRQSWSLSLDPEGRALLEGVEGGPRQGRDASLLLRAATGWEIPVHELGWLLRGLDTTGAAGVEYGTDAHLQRMQASGWESTDHELCWWVRGLEATGAAGVGYGPDGRLQRMKASGWTIEYQEWLPPQDGYPAMPRRLQDERGTARVRLVVDGCSAP